MAMTARMRRIMADYEQVRKDFLNHKNIVVTPIGDEPPEKYHITYYVKGIFRKPDGSIQVLNKHEVEIELHADYPRYKPMCKILTPIWHPNFKDSQICIGDIWGAGESLSDIIVNIGDMIQYKEWNAFSPLSAEAAQWAIENKHLFPIGSDDLYVTEYTTANKNIDIDVLDSENIPFEVKNHEDKSCNDFDITAEELAGIEFVPIAQRTQAVVRGETISKQRINFKTVFMKGLLWAFIGGVIGFIVSELLSGVTDTEHMLRIFGYREITDILNLDEASATILISRCVRLSIAFFSAFVACFIGLFLGLGEGVFYGSKENAVKYALMGAGISLVIGFISGYIAQVLYGAMIQDYTSGILAAFVRGIGWSILGLGVGLSIGLIKPEKRRVLFCAAGGLIGGFLGGVLFNPICSIMSGGTEDTGVAARAVAIVVMALLIGLGIGLLEQYAKQAWLKVIRGEFEGKEYLVFSGVTSIGNNGSNTIVLFKDKLVGPHHCDIIQQGNKYTIVDCGTPMGTIVNGIRIQQKQLQNGDSIAVGNSVLIFNTK